MNPLVWLQLLRAAREVLDAGARLVSAAVRSTTPPPPVEQGASAYLKGRADERWAEGAPERERRAAEALAEAAAPVEPFEPEQPLPESEPARDDS